MPIDYFSLETMLKSKTGLAYYNSSRTELICRCPFCEANSNKRHGHLYIQVASGDTIPLWHCFKCQEGDSNSGTIIKLIRKLGEDPRNYMTPDMISNANSRQLRYTYYKKNFGVKTYIIPELKEHLYKEKCIYLHGRFGFDVNLGLIPGLILNIREFIQNNNIDLGNKSHLLDYYEGNFVGFISNRGTTLTLRNIDSSSPFRYNKLFLTPTGYFKDFYGIKTGAIKDKNAIVLCEGIFDLLVAINSSELQDIKKKSCYWAAILGNKFENVISSVLDICKLTAAHFVILSDSNKKKDKGYSFFSKNPSVLSLDVYYNRMGSDFGKLPINLVKI